MSIEQAQQIFKDYSEPNSYVDSGNLYWALGVALQAIAEAEKQEPFGYLWPTGMHPEFRYFQQKRDDVDGTPVYTSPPQRQPLTDEQIRKANHHRVDGAYDYSFKQGVRWAEAAHGIKGEA
jgi:hypothetical protein